MLYRKESNSKFSVTNLHQVDAKICH